MAALHLEFGRQAEDSALKYFSSRTGATLLERNYRFRGGEIDLIFELSAELRGQLVAELVFVEVRARATDGMLRGFETLGPRKRQRLKRVIEHYLARYRGKARTLRFDVLSWDGQGRGWTHLKNVWL